MLRYVTMEQVHTIDRAHARMNKSIENDRKKRNAFSAQSKANNALLRQHKAEYEASVKNAQNKAALKIRTAQNKAEWNEYNKERARYNNYVRRGGFFSSIARPVRPPGFRPRR